MKNAGQGDIRAVLGEPDGLVTARSAPRADAWRRLQTQSTARAEAGAFQVEGLRAVELLVTADLYPVRELILAVEELEHRQPDTRRRAAALIERARAANVPIWEVTRDVFRHIAGVKKVRGVMAIARDPGRSMDALLDDVVAARGIAIVAVGLADPGNLGTLVRSGVAFGASALFALEGTTEPLHPKVLRAAAGHVLPACRGDWEAFADRCAARGVELVGLCVDASEGAGEVVTLGEGPIVGTDTPVAVCVGSEGRGFPEHVPARLHRRVRIPMQAGSESLNAAIAGSILLWELRR